MNSVSGNWHRRSAGHYVRKRGAIYDTVKRNIIGNRAGWSVWIGDEGGTTIFASRLKATAALDGWILRKEKTAETTAQKKTCDGCNGSGRWFGHGHVENGVFKGPSGKCYRCNGKGHQTAEDEKRNRYYDNHVRRIPA